VVEGKRARNGLRASARRGRLGPDDSAAEAATTIVFDSEDEYVRFTDYVFEKHGGRGVELTNLPIVASIRVKPWLLKQTRGRFAMHPVTPEEIEAAKEAIRSSGRKPFDPANLSDFRVPGIAPVHRPS
jgi:hypothetical protein